MNRTLVQMLELDIEIPFETDRHANIALNSVVQDKEPRSGTLINRFLSLKIFFPNSIIFNKIFVSLIYRSNLEIKFISILSTNFRELSVEGKILKVHWTAEEARILRTSVTSLLQLLTLVSQTIEQFDVLE